MANSQENSIDLPQSPRLLASSPRKLQLVKENLQFSQQSPRKPDPESFDFWYSEAKKHIKQGLYIKTFSYLSRHLERKTVPLTEIQRTKSAKLMICAIHGISLKNYLSKKENLRFAMIAQLLAKSARYLQIFHENLLVLLGNCAETRDCFEKNRRKPRNLQEIAENREKIEEFPEIAEERRKFAAKDAKNAPKARTLWFLLDEFFVLLMKQLIIQGILEKKKKEYQMAAKFLQIAYETSKSFENSKNIDLLQCCVKICVILGNFHAEMFNYAEAGVFYEKALNLSGNLLAAHSSQTKNKGKSRLSFSSHFKQEQTLSFLVILLQNMAFSSEIQENFTKCFESMKLAYWLCSSFFDNDDEISKIIVEHFQGICEKYHVYLRELGDIDRVFTYFFQNHCEIPCEIPKTESRSHDHVQSFNESMYHKYNCQKLNETMFIPLKTELSSQNFTQSTVFSTRILSAKAKIPNNSSDFQRNHEFLATSLVISPTNLKEMQGSRSVLLPQDENLLEKPGISHKRKRVLSAKLERMGYLKLKPKISCDDASLTFSLINKPYEPKQLTTDKYFKSPVFRVKTFQELASAEQNTNNSLPETLEISSKERSSLPTREHKAFTKPKPRAFPFRTSQPPPPPTKSKGIAPQNSSILQLKVQDLDDFFEKFIAKKLSERNQTKPIERIEAEFEEIMKDETFDKKEFDFSKNMLKLKRKYPLPHFSDEKSAAEELNRIKEHTEMVNQAFNINLASGVSRFLQQQRDAQKELEKEQIAQNIYQSTVILQGKQPEIREIPLKKPRWKTLLLGNRAEILKNKPVAEKIESFTKFEAFEHGNLAISSENKRKLQEKHQKNVFLSIVDAYEHELEEIDRELASFSTKAGKTPGKVAKTCSSKRNDATKLAKNHAELANSTNFLSFRAQISKQKNMGLADLVNFKVKTEICAEKDKKNKPKSPLSRAKSRFQVSFDYAKVVESTLL